MRSLKVALFAGAAIAAAFTSANAADLGPIMQAPRMIAPAQVEEQMGGWYLRGDIGVGSQRFKEFDFTQTNQAFVWPASWRIDQREMGDAAFIGAGVGYQFNSWLRADVTGEYRVSSKFKAIGSYTEFCPGGRCFDVYDGNHSAVVLMANGYIDLGTYVRVTPYVGAGVGYSYLSWGGLDSTNYCVDGVGPCPAPGGAISSADHGGEKDWRFTYAFMAGAAYDLTKNLKLDLGYKYRHIDGGDMFGWDDFSDAAGASGIQGTDDGFSTHEVKVGLRYELW